MGIFHHGGRAISYAIDSAPFAHDLLLLQSSKFNTGFWRPLLESLAEGPQSGGRIVTCEWYESGQTDDKLADDLKIFCDSLGLGPLDVVACGEGVPVLKTIEAKHPAMVRKKLAFAHALPKVDEMNRLITEFCGI